MVLTLPVRSELDLVWVRNDYCVYLGCSEIAAQFAMLYGMGHLSPLTQGAVSVGQTNVHGDQSSIIYTPT